MSRTMHFGRDILGAPDVDIEDLLSAMTPSEIQLLVEEMAADPDDKHMPASVRTSYRCDKPPTGKLNRDSLINYINEEGKNSADIEEHVKFELGKKRGKVFVPKYTEEQLAAMKRNEEVAEAVKLDDDEEAALSQATNNDLMALAEILNSNPQEFIREAYSDPLKFYEPDPPNTTDPTEVIKKVTENDKELKEVCLNNISGISEKDFCELFDAFRTNDTLISLSAINCEINDFSAATLALSLEKNMALKSLNLESNRISPDTLASIFESLAKGANGIVEIRVANQAQQNMGYRVESRIADAICKNSNLLKVGLRFEYAEAMNRIQNHLISNIDRLRINRNGSKSGAPGKSWKQAKMV